MPAVGIAHRSFALVKEESEFDGQFGSRAAAKNEILRHWEHANQNAAFFTAGDDTVVLNDCVKASGTGSTACRAS